MSRYRSSISPTYSAAGVSFGRNQFGANNWVNHESVSWSMPSKEARTCTDVVVPNYKQRSAAGEIFNNPFDSRSVIREFSGNFGVENRYNAYISPTDSFDVYQIGMWRHGSAIVQRGLDNHLAVEFSDLDDERRNAIVECLAGVNPTDFDLGTFVAEWGKTRKLHRDVGNALLKVMLPQRLRYKKPRVRKTPLYDHEGRPILNRKGNPVYRYFHTEGKLDGDMALNRAKSAANAYLVGRYGVTPLLRDLESAQKFLLKTHPKRSTARGRIVRSDTVSHDAVLTIDVSSAVLRRQTTRIYEERYGILYESDLLSQMTAGLGLSRPLSTAWELVPYSFVIDWFVNVGSWLDAIQPSLSFKTLSAWVSARDHYVTLYNAGAVTNGVRGVWDQTMTCTLGGYMRTMTNSRNPWTPEAPTFPPLGTGFNKLRSFDFASLVMQKINTRF